MWLERHAVKVALLAAGLFAIVAIIDRVFFTVTPLNIPPPDAHVFGIEEETLGFWLEAMRDRKVQFMALHSFTLDLLLPYFLLAAFVGLTLRFGNRIEWFRKIPLPPKLALCAIFPAFYVLADNYENAVVVVLLEWFPEFLPGASFPQSAYDDFVGMLRMATLFKFVFLTISLLILLGLFVIDRYGSAKQPG